MRFVFFFFFFFRFDSQTRLFVVISCVQSKAVRVTVVTEMAAKNHWHRLTAADRGFKQPQRLRMTAAKAFRVQRGGEMPVNTLYASFFFSEV